MFRALYASLASWDPPSEAACAYPGVQQLSSVMKEKCAGLVFSFFMLVFVNLGRLLVIVKHRSASVCVSVSRDTGK